MQIIGEAEYGEAAVVDKSRNTKHDGSDRCRCFRCEHVAVSPVRLYVAAQEKNQNIISLSFRAVAAVKTDRQQVVVQWWTSEFILYTVHETHTTKLYIGRGRHCLSRPRAT